MRKRNDERLFENKEYSEVQTRNCDKTENSDEKRETYQKRLTKYSTRTDTEDKSHIKEETARYESSITNRSIALDLNAIPASSESQNNGDALINENQLNNLSKNKTRKNRANSPNGQTPQIKKESKKIFAIVIAGPNTNTSNTFETTHSRLTKDNQRLKVCRMSFDSMLKYLNYRCGRRGLKLKKVKVKELFGNISKQRWFIRRKIKILFASNPDNRKVIKKMIKVDPVFKRFVELKFEDIYNNHFVINNRYLPFGGNAMFLSHFKSFGKYLKDELDNSKNEIERAENIEYIKQLIKTGHNLINEIKGGEDYLSRCKRKRVGKRICIIKYK